MGMAAETGLLGDLLERLVFAGLAGIRNAHVQFHKYLPQGVHGEADHLAAAAPYFHRPAG